MTDRRLLVVELAFSLQVLPGGVLGAQSAAIRGTVVGRVTSDSAGAHGVESAEIAIPQISVSVRTSSMGEYRIQLPPGRYVVTARLPGFRALSDSVTVSASSDARLDFVLDQLVLLTLLYGHTRGAAASRGS